MSRATLHCALTVLPIAAFTGMAATPQASAQTQLLRPGVIGWTYGTAWVLMDPDPSWTTVIPVDPFFWSYPRQMTPSGKNNDFIHSVSVFGDLTHGGATRYILDQRWIDGASRSFELIMTPETVATEENPTWYYDGMGADELTDLVLLDSTEFDVLGQARWSVDGTRIAFQAHRVIDDVSGIFVADLVFDGGGEPAGIDTPVCVVPGGLAPSWGNSSRFACYKDTPTDTSAYVVDVTDPLDPIEIPIPTSFGARDVISFSGGWSGLIPSAAALSHDGNCVAYSKTVGGEADIYVYDIDNEQEKRVTDRSRITPTCLNSNNSPDRWIWSPEWSPDDEQLVFVAYWCGPAQSYSPGGTLFTISVNGTETAKKITRAYVGAPSTVVNFYIRAMWRGDVAVTPPVDLPVAPSSLTAVAGSSSQIQLTWIDNSSSEDGFHIDRSLDGAAWSQFTSVGPGATAYLDTGLAASTPYHYRVRAFNAAGASAYSDTASATTLAGGGSATSVHVESIALSTANAGQGRKMGRAQVLFVDDLGNPVQFADVTGTFTGDYNETLIVETDANGVADILTVQTKKGGVSFEFCVDGVTHGTLTYASGANVVTCATF